MGKQKQRTMKQHQTTCHVIFDQTEIDGEAQDSCCRQGKQQTCSTQSFNICIYPLHPPPTRTVASITQRQRQREYDGILWGPSVTDLYRTHSVLWNYLTLYCLFHKKHNRVSLEFEVDIWSEKEACESLSSRCFCGRHVFYNLPIHGTSGPKTFHAHHGLSNIQ